MITQGGLYNRAARICCLAFGFGSVVAGILSFGFVIISFTQISIGLYQCGFSLWTSGFQGHVPPEDASILLILHSLELLLIAPLPFLILSSVASFVGEWELQGKVSQETRAKMEDAKMLLYGIFTGIITLDFIGKAVSNRIASPSAEIQLAGLFLVALFLFVSEAISLWRQRLNVGSKE